MDTKEVDELHEWQSLIHVAQPLIAHINTRIESLILQRDRLNKPSIDQSYLMTDLTARINELREVLREIEWKDEIFKREVLNVRTKGHPKSAD